MKTITWSIIKENIFNDIDKYFMDIDDIDIGIHNIRIIFRQLEINNFISTRNDCDFIKKFIKNEKIKTSSVKNEKIKTLLMMFMDMTIDEINKGWVRGDYTSLKENNKDDINNIILKYLSKI